MKKISKIILGILLVCSMALCVFACTSTPQHTVTLNDGVTTTTVSVDEGATYQLNAPEDREGYEFLGWYDNDSYSGSAVTSVTVNKAVTYYAKWDKLIKITLDANGGTLNTQYIYVKKNANLSEALSGVTPTHGTLTFGAWFSGNSEVSANATATKDTTLTAKYKAGYTVEIYKQKLDKSGYEKDSEVITDYAYVGEPFTSVQTVDGFNEIKHDDAVTTTQSLSATASENVFKHYFDRREFLIAYNTNYPADSGMNNDVVSVDALYGEEVTVPVDYFCDGYYLAGWSDEPDGEILYNATQIDKFVFNKEEGEVGEAVVDTFVASEAKVLYAVWSVGYKNMFGGDDKLFILDKQGEYVYLSRGGLLFRGEYYPSRQEFCFIYNDEILLEGKLLGEDIYAYYSSDRYDMSATLFEVTENGPGENSRVRILFDEYNGLTYYETGKDAKNATGTYVIDENGYYIVTFDEGDFAGQTMTISITTTEVNGTTTRSFSIRNEEEYAMGTLARFDRENKNYLYYSNGYYDLTLTGFGRATRNVGNGVENLYYSMDPETKIITLLNSTGEKIETVRYTEVRLGQEVKKGYILYDERLDRTISSADGVEVTFDGTFKATYKNGNTKVECEYSVSESVFGGLIARLSAVTGTNAYTFYIEMEEHEVTTETEEGEEETTIEITYTLHERANGYAEYYYSNESSIYYAPLFVFNEAEEGKAFIYGYTSDGNFEKVSEGTYATNDAGHYVYTMQTADSEVDVIKTPFNIARIKSVEFAVGDNNGYNVSYWFSYTTVNDVERPYGKLYTATDGSTLNIVGAFAIYTYDDKTVTGTYQIAESKFVTLQVDNGYFFELTGEDTFIKLTFAPYTAYSNERMEVYGNMYVMMLTGDEDEYIMHSLDFDGKGGGVFKTILVDGDSETVTSEVSGTITETGDETKEGAPIYKFSSTETEFFFIRLAYSGNDNEFFAISDGYGKKYTSDGYATLTLDGYGMEALYIDDNGDEHKGAYAVSETNVIVLIGEDEKFIFDLNTNTFSLRSAEYGTYVIMDNWASQEIYVDLDGKGGAFVYEISNEDKHIIDDEATYTADDGIITLNYYYGGEDIILTGNLTTYSFNANGGVYTGEVLVKLHEEVVRKYLNPDDWSMLILSELGTATKYGSDGTATEGRYVLITDNLLYFETDNEKDSCIYNYETENNTISPVELQAVGYYTKELDSIVFTKYGFVVFGGTDKHYYNIETNGGQKEVVVYKQDATNPDASKYGFVREVFGGYPFEKTKQYGENNEQYIINNGTEIVFKRDSATAEKYPVSMTDGNKYALETISFAPTGEDEFRVPGSVVLNGNANECYIEGKRAGGVLSLSIILGSYTFDISVNYQGEDDKGQTLSTYSVESMEGHMTMYPYDYVDFLYMVSIYYGPAYMQFVTNTHGMIDIVQSYDEEGNETLRAIDAEFYERSGMFDLKGNPVSITGADYESDEKTGEYSVTFTAEDGYDYKIYFTSEWHGGMGSYGYTVDAFVRLQTVTGEGGYKMETERVVHSMSGRTPGALYKATLYKDEVEIDYWAILSDGAVNYYISRTFDTEEKITSTTYYKLTLTDAPTGEIGSADTKIVAPYADGFTVETLEVKTLYTEDGESYVDILTGENAIILINLDGNIWGVGESDYDEATNSYVITIGETYRVTVNGETITVEETNG
ncbi:MAG: InlB B-repeat-containing protein [Clostridia bacterium]|nr:InlB B-repeat-containing protein [Clostridia bacterium]